MGLEIPTIAIILLATFPVSDFARIRLDRVEKNTRFKTQAQVVVQNDADDIDKSVVEEQIDKAFEDRATSAADGAEAGSAGAPITAVESPAAVVQEAVVQGEPTDMQAEGAGAAFGKVVEAGGEQLDRVLDKVGERPGRVTIETPSSVSKTLDHMKSASCPYSALKMLNAACDSNAFSCEEIIQIVNNCWPRDILATPWRETVMVFARKTVARTRTAWRLG